MNCACHDVAMYWANDKRYRAGGFYRCAVKQRQQVRARYIAAPEIKISKQRRRRADALVWAKEKIDARRIYALKQQAKRSPADPRAARFLVAVKTRRTVGQVQAEG